MYFNTTSDQRVFTQRVFTTYLKLKKASFKHSWLLQLVSEHRAKYNNLNDFIANLRVGYS